MPPAIRRDSARPGWPSSARKGDRVCHVAVLSCCLSIRSILAAIPQPGAHLIRTAADPQFIASARPRIVDFDIPQAIANGSEMHLKVNADLTAALNGLATRAKTDVWSI